MASIEDNAAPSVSESETIENREEMDSTHSVEKKEKEEETAVTTPKADSTSTEKLSKVHKDDTGSTPRDFQDGYSFGYSNIAPDRPDASMPVESSSRHYNMQHKKRGLAVIVAYEKFGIPGASRRLSARHDAEVCEEAFQSLGYETQTHWDLRKEDFRNALNKVSTADHSDSDSLVVIFMSHGGVNKEGKGRIERLPLGEYLSTYDGEISTRELWKNFTPDKCPSLAGKPKMFFIQACRGEETDKGVRMKNKKTMTVHTDSGKPPRETEYAIPLHADMLMMWASYPGMVAFRYGIEETKRNSIKGSVFLHFLCQVLRRDARLEDLSSMLLTVTREVAIQFETDMKNEYGKYDEPDHAAIDWNKQIPYTESTLMRKVRFFSDK